MKSLPLYLMIFLLTGYAWAGVVEDADEELKKAGQGKQTLQHVGTTNTGYPSPPSTTSNGSGQPSVRTPDTRNRVRGRSTNSTGASVQGGSASVEVEKKKPEAFGRARVDSESEKKGKLISWGVVIFLALLIAIATVLSRRLGQDE